MQVGAEAGLSVESGSVQEPLTLQCRWAEKTEKSRLIRPAESEDSAEGLASGIGLAGVMLNRSHVQPFSRKADLKIVTELLVRLCEQCAQFAPEASKDVAALPIGQDAGLCAALDVAVGVNELQDLGVKGATAHNCVFYFPGVATCCA